MLMTRPDPRRLRINRQEIEFESSRGECHTDVRLNRAVSELLSCSGNVFVEFVAESGAAGAVEYDWVWFVKPPSRGAGNIARPLYRGSRLSSNFSV